MRVLAFDLGGTMGWALAENDTALAFGEFTIAQKKDTRGWRFARLRQALFELVEQQRPDYIIYERPICRGVHATRSLWGYAAVIEQVAFESDLMSIDQLPGSIKSFATGRGDAGKPAMIEAASLEVVCFDLNEHEADAIMLALYALRHVQAT